MAHKDNIKNEEIQKKLAAGVATGTPEVEVETVPAAVTKSGTRTGAVQINPPYDRSTD